MSSKSTRRNCTLVVWENLRAWWNASVTAHRVHFRTCKSTKLPVNLLLGSEKNPARFPLSRVFTWLEMHAACHYLSILSRIVLFRTTSVQLQGVLSLCMLLHSKKLSWHSTLVPFIKFMDSHHPDRFIHWFAYSKSMGPHHPLCVVPKSGVVYLFTILSMITKFWHYVNYEDLGELLKFHLKILSSFGDIWI